MNEPVFTNDSISVQPDTSISDAVHSSDAIAFSSRDRLVYSHTNGRENNEDSYILCDLDHAKTNSPLTLLGIADGMGGHAFGEEVSRETLRSVALSLFEQLVVEPSLNGGTHADELSADSAETLSQSLINALEQANAHVRRMVEVNKWGKAGSTAVVALLSGNSAVVANLGDSPMFHYQASQRQLSKVTEDHTVAGVLLRGGLITPEMARVHEGRSRLEFYVGSSHFPREAPIYHVALAPNDILLLCSDGVSGSLLNEDIERIMQSTCKDISSLSQALIEAALKTGETDNQTLILWLHRGNRLTVAPEQDATKSLPPSPIETDNPSESPTNTPPSSASRLSMETVLLTQDAEGTEH